MSLINTSHEWMTASPIAMAVRNGPLENLHAGKSSPVLEDDTLSRLTDDDVKAIMIYATRMVAMMLRVRDGAPDVYRRYVSLMPAGIAGRGSVHANSHQCEPEPKGEP